MWKIYRNTLLLLDSVKSSAGFLVNCPRFLLLRLRTVTNFNRVFSECHTEKEAFLIYLYGPIAILILSNIVFFVMTAILLYRASVDAAFAVNSAHAKQK